jgi:phenylalanine-4-hydroxylase
LQFESGIGVEGLLESFLYRGDKLILLTFIDCTVSDAKQETLFLPEWGTYDMAVGEKIISVFNGAADKSAYDELQHVSEKKAEKVIYDKKALKLQEIYGRVREIRESGVGKEELADLFNILKNEYPEDWLAVLEVFEIVKNSDSELQTEVLSYLNRLKENPEYSKLIEDGLYVIDNPVRQLQTLR